MHNFKKQYGQNFLKGSKFVTKIVEALHLIQQDTVIEIGPGDGVLTSMLLKTGAKVICIEIDYDLLPPLIRKFNETPNFNLIHEDILKIDLSKVLKDNKIEGNFKVAGSLPYNISKRIIDKFLSYEVENGNNLGLHLESMVFIVQEEVAKEYIAASPKSTFLSNYIRVFAEVKKLESISAIKFYPVPKVNGGILLIKPRTDINTNYDQIVKLIRIGFISPRKTLLRNLKNSNKYDSNILDKIFNKLNIKETIRPAELENELWFKLYSLLSNSQST